MKAFELHRPTTAEAAANALGDGALLKAGGVDVLDRLKERVDEPDRVVSLVDLGDEAKGITREGRVIVIGAQATLASIAASDLVPSSVRRAAAQAASPQIRNLATLGGNLCQHTRCGYYRLKSFPCLKRGDDDCPVLADGAVQENAGIFANRPCASAHPSSLAPSLGTAGAVLQVVGAKGAREIAFEDLWAAPAKGRASDTTLAPTDVIAHVVLQARDASAGWRVAHEEIRQKAAFDWPLVTCAVALRAEGGKVAEASVWLGAVAPTPLRSVAAETVLTGKAFDEALAAKAGEAAVGGATPLAGTKYKVQLVKVAVRRALARAWGRA